MVCGLIIRVFSPWITRIGAASPVASALNTRIAPPSATGIEISSFTSS